MQARVTRVCTGWCEGDRGKWMDLGHVLERKSVRRGNTLEAGDKKQHQEQLPDF